MRSPCFDDVMCMMRGVPHWLRWVTRDRHCGSRAWRRLRAFTPHPYPCRRLCAQTFLTPLVPDEPRVRKPPGQIIRYDRDTLLKFMDVSVGAQRAPPLLVAVPCQTATLPWHVTAWSAVMCATHAHDSIADCAPL
jgi:hypothetical protein